MFRSRSCPGVRTLGLVVESVIRVRRVRARLASVNIRVYPTLRFT
jgi:hypothetical protein